MKEAYVKYVGEGLSIPLNSFRIDRGKGGNSCLAYDEQVIFRTFFTEDEYCVSLCGKKEADIQSCDCMWNVISIQDIDAI